MKTAIKGTGVEVTTEIADYIDQKVRAFDRFVHDGKEALAEVELRKEEGVGHTGKIYYAEVNLTIDGKLYRATANEASFQAALDEVKDEMLRELRSTKQKRLFSIRDGGKRVKAWLTGSGNY